MKRFYLIAICTLVLALFVACDNGGNIQPTMVPTQPPATATPIASDAPTATSVPTETPTPTPTPRPTLAPITPLPEQGLTDGSDFLEIMRILGAGTQVDTTGASTEALDRCFYAENLNANDKKALAEAGYAESTVSEMQKIRILYYRKDGCVYIGEFFADYLEAADIMSYFKESFEAGERITGVEPDHIDDYAAAKGLGSKVFTYGSRSYLFLYKQGDN